MFLNIELPFLYSSHRSQSVSWMFNKVFIQMWRVDRRVVIIIFYTFQLFAGLSDTFLYKIKLIRHVIYPDLNVHLLNTDNVIGIIFVKYSRSRLWSKNMAWRWLSCLLLVWKKIQYEWLTKFHTYTWKLIWISISYVSIKLGCCL